MQCELLSDKDKERAKENPDAEGIQCTYCLLDEMRAENREKNNPDIHAFGRIWDTYWFPLDQDTFLHYALDITERKQAEKKIKHLNSVLSAIRNVNQLITKERDRDKLLQGVCDKLIEARGYNNA